MDVQDNLKTEKSPSLLEEERQLLELAEKMLSEVSKVMDAMENSLFGFAEDWGQIRRLR